MMDPSNFSSYSISNCSGNEKSYAYARILEGTLAGIGLMMCVISILLTVILKLYKKLIYRLALYQVLTALIYAAGLIMEVSIPYRGFPDPYHSLCTAVAVITSFASLAKVSFVLVMTIHIFAFAVCNKNLKNLEACYILISVVVPGLMAAVPLITDTYGHISGSSPVCWISHLEDNNINCTTSSTGVIEVYVLWFVPSLCCLVVVTCLVTIMLIVLTFRSRVYNYSQTGSTTHMTVIKQICPLMAYPILFCILLSISLIHSICNSASVAKDSEAFDVIDTICFTGYIWTSSLTFIVHICVVMRSKKKSPSCKPLSNESQILCTNNETVRTARTRHSDTYFSIPLED